MSSDSRVARWSFTFTSFPESPTPQFPISDSTCTSRKKLLRTVGFKRAQRRSELVEWFAVHLVAAGRVPGVGAILAIDLGLAMRTSNTSWLANSGGSLSLNSTVLSVHKSLPICVPINPSFARLRWQGWVE